MFVTCVYDLAENYVLCDLQKTRLSDVTVSTLLFVK